MKRFKTVFSLNYDLIVYWAIMDINNSLGHTWFKDCFDGDGSFRDNWRDLRNPYGDAEGATLVFYPHGNLTLTTSVLGAESKVRVGTANDDLLGRFSALGERATDFRYLSVRAYQSRSSSRSQEADTLRLSIGTR